MNKTRRRILYTVGLGCAVAGFYVSWELDQRRLAVAEQEANKQLRKHVIDAFASAKLLDLEGNPTSLPVGEKRFLLNFWATWCPPCLHEMPLLHEANDAQTLPVYGLAVDKMDAVKAFLAERDFDYPMVVAGLTGGVELAEDLGSGLQGMPYTVVVEADGQLGNSKIGPFANVEEIRQFYAE